MKTRLILFFYLFLNVSFSGFSQNEKLFKYYDSIENCGYLNSKSEVIIPTGKYAFCFSDSSSYFVSVAGYDGKIYALNYNIDTLFEIYNYDNGPDYISNGLFRISKKDKIGFANKKGEIIIPFQYSCAFPFSDGKAKVSINCKPSNDSIAFQDQNVQWFFIDLNGKRVE